MYSPKDEIKNKRAELTSSNKITCEKNHNQSQ